MEQAIRNDKYTVTVYSNRLYINEKEQTQIINNEFVSICDETMVEYQKILFSVYNLLYLEETNNEKYQKILDKKSLYKYVVSTFNINGYFANSIINKAKGIINSQTELNSLYKQQKNEDIKTISKEIEDIQKDLGYLIIIRNEFKEYRKKLQENPKTKIKLKGVKNLTFQPEQVIVRFGPEKQEELSYSKFEYEYLNPKIKRLKNSISQKTYRLNNVKKALENIETIKPITFRNGILTEIQKAEEAYKKRDLKEEFINSKYYDFQISGVNNTIFGNQIFHLTYVPDSEDFNLTIRFPKKEITLSHIDFPYRKSEIIQILRENININTTANQKRKDLRTKKKENQNISNIDEEIESRKYPLCFSIVRKIDKENKQYYYQVKLVFDLSINKRINDSVVSGIIGMDFNYGHLDLTEINEKGAIISHKTIYYDLTGTSKQNELSLRKAIKEACEYAKSKHKCLVIEDLDFKYSKFKFNRDKRQQRKLNKIIHSLPNALYKQAVEYTALKNEFAVYYVKPAYTSIVGCLKYADKMKLNSHVSASYVIARRGLGFKEHLTKEQMELIPENKKKDTLFNKWKYLNRLDKKNKKKQQAKKLQQNA